MVNEEIQTDLKIFISGQIEALRIARGHRDIKSLSEEFKPFGVKYDSFNNYAKGSVEPKAGFLAAMHQFGINLDWLVAGEGEMYRANRLDQSIRQDVVNYAKESNVVTTGVNNGHIVAEVGIQQYNTESGGRGQRLCEWVREYAAAHSDADVGHLVERMRRAFPEFEDWDRK